MPPRKIPAQTSPLAGGNGGIGGQGIAFGGGGAGGYGALLTGAGANSNTDSITGGTAGSGGFSANATLNVGGSGGDGGVAAKNYTLQGLLTNSGAVTIASGGQLTATVAGITTDRTVTVTGNRLRANFNANAYSGRLEGGYRFVMPWMMDLTPYAAGQFTTFELPAYAESAVSGAGIFALAYNGKSVTASRSELGLRSDKSYAMADRILTLRGRAAWAHDFNPDRSIAATFQALPGASFVVNGAGPARNAALTTASAEMKWQSGFSLAANFEGEFSAVTHSYAGKGVARLEW